MLIRTIIFLLYSHLVPSLVAFKILLSIVLIGKACQYVREAGLLDRLLKKKSDPPKFTETASSSSSTSAPPPTKAASEPHKQTTAAPPTIADLRMPSCDPGLALPLSPTTLQSFSSSNLLASDSSISILSRHVEAGEAVRRPKGAVSQKSQPTDISEIDRYTLCGNRIV